MQQGIPCNFGGVTVYKIRCVLKKQFDVDCTDITEIYGGLSAVNYRVEAKSRTFFLKTYDKKKAQASLWTENIDSYMPILVWLNENTKLQGRIARPIKTNNGSYRFDDDDNVFLLFDFIEGQAAGETLTHTQLLEAAELIACLHSYGDEIHADGDEIHADMGKIKEDFSVPFCYSIMRFIREDYQASPADLKTILRPFLDELISKGNEVISLSEKVKQKDTKLVLCHTDAHGWNIMQSKQLVLVDWEGMRLAPAEADLIMFTKIDYWNIFIEQYSKLRPEFILDNDILSFYIMRRKVEDIWAFIEGILHDNQSDGQRERDLHFLSRCCSSLNDPYFEL